MTAEIYVVIGILFAGWVAWISTTVISNQRKIDKLTVIASSFPAMKMDFDNQFKNTDRHIQGLSQRLDIFLNKELQTLKDIAAGRK